MSYSPLTVSRRHVLGDLYARCERLVEVPVYLNEPVGEKLGFVDESRGHYADAFTFHLSEEACKKLAGGQFTFSFNYEFANKSDASLSPNRRRVKLTSITLVMRKGYEKPQPKNATIANVEVSDADR